MMENDAAVGSEMKMMKIITIISLFSFSLERMHWDALESLLVFTVCGGCCTKGKNY